VPIPLKNIITIHFSDPIGWTLLRLFKSNPDYILTNIENVEELENVDLLNQGSIIFLFFKNKKYFHQWHWEEIRRKHHSLLPILTFGFTKAENIRYSNRLFSKHGNNYGYVQLPSNLLIILEYIDKLIPIYDQTTLDNHDRHCSDNKEQIHGYAHDLKNKFFNLSDTISGQEIKEIIICFDKIIDNWDNSGITKIKKEDVILERQNFFLNKQFEQTFALIKNIYEITA
jgi:hypothetical protein